MNQQWLQVMEGRRHLCSADLCSLIEVSPALVLYWNRNCLMGCERCEGENPAVTQNTSLLSTFCDLPAHWTFFYLLIVDLIDGGGGGGMAVVWGFLCVW